VKYLLGAIAALAMAAQPVAAQSPSPFGSLFEAFNQNSFRTPPMPWRLRAEPARAPVAAGAPNGTPYGTAAQAYPPAPNMGYAAQQAPAAARQGYSSPYGSPAYGGNGYGANGGNANGYGYGQPAQPGYGVRPYEPAQPGYAAAPRREESRQAPRRGLFGWLSDPFAGTRSPAAAPEPQLQQASLQPAANEEYLHRKIVPSGFSYEPGTVVIDTGNRFLYLLMEDGQALRYGVGVGRQGFEWSGSATIGRKAEWPDWIPPEEMREREPWLPERVPGGLENPLGARALYLFEGSKDTLYRIHGTNQPETIGQALSSGCIRMLNEDVMDLYQRVPEGTRVVVI
jgi:lipoprotein-anchoring transpeptidase ErfK/SrfK